MDGVAAPAAVHVFVCAGGRLLPRWREAFPAALGVQPGAPVLLPPAVLWLRLDRAASAAEQVVRVRREGVAAPLVVLSDEPDEDEAMAAFAAGARGYCNAHATPEFLRQVAVVVGEGGLWIGETLMSRLLTAVSRHPAPAATDRSWAAPLTGREREVALAVATGASNKEVARTLGITERTVKAHVGAILEKLGVRDRLRLSLLVNGRAPA